MNAGDYIEDEYEAAGLGIRLLKLAAEQQKFSEATFGSIRVRGPKASLEHLMKEAKEAWEKPCDIEEHADILLLLFDSRWRNGWTLRDLLNAAEAKLDKNKRRDWDTEWLFEEPYWGQGLIWVCKAWKGSKLVRYGYGNTPDEAYHAADRIAREYDQNHGVSHTKSWCVWPPVKQVDGDWCVEATREGQHVHGFGKTPEQATLNARTLTEKLG